MNQIMIKLDKEQITDIFFVTHEAYVRYLEEKCNLHGKTLVHYPDAVERYVPRYIRKYLDPNFTSFYSLDIDTLRKIYEQLQNSHQWEKELKRKSTWNLRLKAIDYFISFRTTEH